MRAFLAAVVSMAAVSSVLVACGGNKGGGGGGDDAGVDGTPCVGLECQIVDCAAQAKPSTTITGTVYAPNGTLPLYGVNVYIPRETPAPFTDGAQCSRCSDELSGSPLSSVQTDDQGHFVLENVPSGDSIPLVITTGKWRRQISITRVESCTETALIAEQTRLPKDKTEGDLPRIAITTGDADTMECLPRKLGIADSEITNSAGAGRVHLYAGDGVARFKDGFAGGDGTTLSGAEPFWSSVDNLKAYDVVILSCEGSQIANGTPKSQTALDAMKEYADLGGRVFASHWHNVWISGKYQGGVGAPTQAAWSPVATWQSGNNFNGPDVIDEAGHGKGMSFASWMQNVGASPISRGEFDVTEGRTTVATLDTAKAERWVYRKDGGMNAQMLQFTTPIEADTSARCGKVVFTDMHVSGTGGSGSYPDNCVGGEMNTELTAQEKALAFMFFDIASCVGPIF